MISKISVKGILFGISETEGTVKKRKTDTSIFKKYRVGRFRCKDTEGVIKNPDPKGGRWIIHFSLSSLRS